MGAATTVRVARTTDGEVDHLDEWQYFPYGDHKFERFVSRRGVRVGGDCGKRQMLLWNNKHGWRASTLTGADVPIIDIGGLHLRLLLLRSPEEVLEWVLKR